MTHKRRMIIDASKYSVSSLIANLLGAVRSIFTANLLGPAMMGMWQIFSMVINYSNYAHGGVISAIGREVPYEKGRKQFDKLLEVKRISLTFVIIAAIIASIVVFTASFFFPESSAAFRWGMRIVSVVCFTQLIYSFYSVLIHAEDRFNETSKSLLIFAITYTGFAILLTWLFSIYGLLIAVMLGNIITIVYIIKKVGFPFKATINLKELIRLGKIGIPVFLFSFGGVLLRSVDNIMIASFMTIGMLGFYSVGIMMIEFVQIVPISISRILSPKIIAHYGEKQKVSELRHFIEQGTTAIAYLIPLVLGAIFIITPMFINIFMPKYAPGIWPARIIVMGSFFAVVTFGLSSFFLAINKQIHVIYHYLFATAILFLLEYVFIKYTSLGIAGVAIAASIVNFVLFTTMMIFAYVQYRNLISSAFEAFKLVVPFFYMLICLGAIYIIFPEGTFFSLAISLLAYAALNIPLLVYMNKKTGVLSEMLGIAKSVRKSRQN